jgi:pilus assembly protein CpaE
MPTSLVIANADDKLRSTLGRIDRVWDKEARRERPTGIDIVASFASLEHLLEQMRWLQAPAVLLLDINVIESQPEHLGSSIRSICTRWPNTTIVISGPKERISPQLLLRHGIVHHIARPCTVAEVIGTVQHAANSSTPGGRGYVLAIHPLWSGTGGTFVATSLAIALATELGAKVALIDLNIWFNDASHILPPETNPPAYTLRDVLSKVRLLDQRLLGEQMLYLHTASGIRVLPSPDTWGNELCPNLDDLPFLLLTLRSQFDYVIIDTPPLLDNNFKTVLYYTDKVYLIFSVDVATTYFLRYFRGFMLRNDTLEKIVPVLNKTSNEHLLGPISEIESIVGPIEIGIPLFTGMGTEQQTSAVVSGWDNSMGRTFAAMARLIARDLPTAKVSMIGPD